MTRFTVKRIKCIKRATSQNYYLCVQINVYTDVSHLNLNTTIFFNQFFNTHTDTFCYSYSYSHIMQKKCLLLRRSWYVSFPDHAPVSRGWFFPPGTMRRFRPKDFVSSWRHWPLMINSLGSWYITIIFHA